MTLHEFRESFASTYINAGADSAGFDAMDSLGHYYQDRLVEIIGHLEWDRPNGVRPESKDKLIKELTFGDLYIDSANIKFYFEWLILEFHGDKRPYIGPSLKEYGLDSSLGDSGPPYLPLPGEYIVLPNNDTLKGYHPVVVRGRIDIDWQQDLRERFRTKRNPLGSISMKDCQIIEILPREY